VVAKAEPDGYTLLTWNDSLLINPWLFKDVPFAPKQDFIPISLSPAAFSPIRSVGGAKARGPRRRKSGCRNSSRRKESFTIDPQSRAGV
jgi:hypothetical protein